jgi:hypothetical protein
MLFSQSITLMGVCDLSIYKIVRLLYHIDILESQHNPIINSKVYESEIINATLESENQNFNLNNPANAFTT